MLRITSYHTVFPIVLLIGLLFANEAEAQSQTSRIVAVVNVPEMVGIEISEPEIVVDAIPEGTDGAYAAITGTTTMRLRGNAPRDVRISAATDRMTHEDSGEESKPVSDVEWNLVGSEEWTPLSTTPTRVLIERERGVTDVEIRFRMHIDADRDLPGRHVVELEVEVVPT